MANWNRSNVPDRNRRTMKYFRSKGIGTRMFSFFYIFDLMITFCAPIHSIFPLPSQYGLKGCRMKAILEWKINKHWNGIFMKPIFVTTFQLKCRGSPYRRYPIYWFPFPIYFCFLFLHVKFPLGRREIERKVTWRHVDKENYSKFSPMWCV